MSYYTSYLKHHGILGQKWGKKNGPPYPLDASDHSASEKKAGWKKSLDKSTTDKHTQKKGLSDKQKRAIKIGAAVVATAIVAVGGYQLYKHGKLDGLIDKINTSKDHVKTALQKKNGDTKFGETAVQSLKEHATEKITGSFKKLTAPEKINDVIKHANPNRGNPSYQNNCTYCSVASFLRSIGYDVIAKDSGGKQQLLGGVIESCFKGARVIDGSAVKFGRSPLDASEMLVKKFGENASGVCGIQYKGGTGGHAFNWVIKNGAVKFFDGQDVTSPINDPRKIEQFWKLINPNDHLTIARLDNAEIIEDAIKEFVQ